MPVYKGLLKFNSNEDYKNFHQALKTAFDEERSVPINGIDKVETFIETSAGKQMLFEHDKISSFFIFPNTEDIPYTLKTDYGDYTFNFKRLVKENEIVIKNETNAIMQIRIEFKLHEKTVNYTYKVQFSFAKDIETIFKTYNATSYLLKKLFKQTVEGNKAIDSLKASELYWKHVYELEKFLNLRFIPSEIGDIVEDVNKIEELYILLLKNAPIRRNLNNVKLTIKKDNIDVKEVDKGKEIKIGVIETLDYKIYGASFSIYTFNLFFNSYVDSMLLDQNEAEYIITCNSIDDKPLYRSSLAFKTKEQAQTALKEPSKYESTLLNARPLYTLIQEVRKV